MVKQSIVNKKFLKAGVEEAREILLNKVTLKTASLRGDFDVCELIEKKGHSVDNTAFGIDLDIEYEQVKQHGYDVVTAFEIFEHLVSPFPLLKAIEANKLVASVPLKLWFASAYWSETDPYDRHYHEFEPRQFDMLLEKAGWVIKKYELWNPYTKGFGIRPLLRKFTPRYYIVYCERKQ